MQSYTYGSDEGYNAVHEAMMQYITKPLMPNSNLNRGAFHASFNLNDATMLLDVLQLVIETPAGPQAMNDTEAYQSYQETRDWAERYYRDLAGTVGVELV